jgi:hypothetical protein
MILSAYLISRLAGTEQRNSTFKLTVSLAKEEKRSMSTSLHLAGLELTGEEAFSLLMLALTSPQKLDATSERAVRKLAAYCRASEPDDCHHHGHHNGELYEAG